MMNTVKGAAILGASTLGAAIALQQLYKVTDFYPPKPVFWFFSGVTAFLLLEGAERISGKDLVSI